MLPSRQYYHLPFDTARLPLLWECVWYTGKLKTPLFLVSSDWLRTAVQLIRNKLGLGLHEALAFLDSNKVPICRNEKESSWSQAWYVAKVQYSE